MQRDPDVKIGISVEDRTRQGLAEAERSVRESMRRQSAAAVGAGGGVSEEERRVREVVAGRIRAQRMTEMRERVNAQANARLVAMGMPGLATGAGTAGGPPGSTTAEGRGGDGMTWWGRQASDLKNWNAQMQTMRRVAALGGILVVARALGNAASEAVRLRNELDAGAKSAGEIAEEAVGLVPVLGDVWRAGRSIRELFTGEKLMIQQAKAAEAAIKSAIALRSAIQSAGESGTKALGTIATGQEREIWSRQGVAMRPWRSQVVEAMNQRDARLAEIESHRKSIIAAAKVGDVEGLDQLELARRRLLAPLEARAAQLGLSLEQARAFNVRTEPDEMERWAGHSTPQLTEREVGIQRLQQDAARAEPELVKLNAAIKETRRQLEAIDEAASKVMRNDVILRGAAGAKSLIESLRGMDLGAGGGLMSKIPGAAWMTNLWGAGDYAREQAARRFAQMRDIQSSAGSMEQGIRSQLDRTMSQFLSSARDEVTSGNVGMLSGRAKSPDQYLADMTSQMKQVVNALPTLTRMAELLSRLVAQGPGLAVRVAEF